MTKHDFSALALTRQRIQRRDALALMFLPAIYLLVLLEMVFLSAKPSFWAVALFSGIGLAFLVIMLLIGSRAPITEPAVDGVDS